MWSPNLTQHTRPFLIGIRTLARNPVVVSILLAGGVRFMAGFAIAGFLPLYFETAFPDFITAYSIGNASVVSIGGALSSYAGGAIADRITARQGQHMSLFVPAVGSVLGICAMAAVLYVRNFWVATVCLLIEYIVAECWFGPTIAALQTSLPTRARGIGIGAFGLITTTFGSLMTFILGFLLKDGAPTITIQNTLMVSIGVSYFISSMIFSLSAWYMKHGKPIECSSPTNILTPLLLATDDE